MTKQQKKIKGKRTKTPNRDYAALKLAYMASETVEVKVWWECSIGVWDGSAEKHTRGWRPEKDKQREEDYQALSKKVREEKQEVLAGALSDAIHVSATILKKASKLDGGANMDVVKKAWTVIRTESGLPTNITHNTNVNTNEQRDIDAAAKLLEELGIDQKAGKDSKDAAVPSSHPEPRADGKPTKKKAPTK